MEDIPGVGAEAGAEDHGVGDPVEDQPDDELEEAARGDHFAYRMGMWHLSNRANTPRWPSVAMADQ